jgi:hypothetical protein
MKEKEEIKNVLDIMVEKIFLLDKIKKVLDKELFELETQGNQLILRIEKDDILEI